MDYDEFVGRVQRRLGLEFLDEAAEATHATLSTLGERLDRDHQRHLAAQLPGVLGEWVLERDQTQRFVLQDFYRRVAARANVRLSDATERAHAVMQVLREAVAEGELRDVFEELPDDFRNILGVGPQPPRVST